MASKSQPHQTWPFLGHAELGRHLIQQLDQQRLPKAVLFVGPRAVGKGSAARWMMEYDLCQSKEQRPCGRCAACRQTQSDSHPNAQVIDAADSASVGIETLRQVIHQYGLVSWSKARRWLVIIDAERLTEAASNTMLKFLEEIPPDLQVIMTSSRPEQLLPTLRSRLTSYQWHFVAPNEIAAPTALVRQVAARSAGRPGWSQDLQDQASVTADVERAAEITERFTQPQSAGRDRLSKDRAVMDELMTQEEIVLRELLLRTVGSQRRLLWPTTTLANTLSLASVTTLIKKYLDRYELSSNVQPRLLYEDLHLA